MGYKDVKKRVIQALHEGSYLSESRPDIDVKNKLEMGEISPQEVADIIRKSKGTEHTKSPHHYIPEIEVNIIKSQGWYIKFYFSDPNTFFISVHR